MIEQHMQVHSRIYICAFCNEEFVDPSKLSEHKKEIHPLHDRRRMGIHFHVCNANGCGKKYVSDKLLKLHQRKHESGYVKPPRNLKTYKCSYCPKIMNSKSRQIEHESTHREDRPYSCTVCGKVYKTKKQLAKHGSEVHREKTYRCPDPDCPSSFNSEYKLKRHTFVHLGKEKPTLPCSICNKLFHKKSGLDLHVKIQHRLKGKFSCPSCPAKFGTKNGLSKHSVTHSSPSFTCHLCGKSFKQSRTLNQHEMSAHLGVESFPFVCTQCPRRFNRIDLLNLHVMKESHFPPGVQFPDLFSSKTNPVVPASSVSAEPPIDIENQNNSDRFSEITNPTPMLHIPYPTQPQSNIPPPPNVNVNPQSMYFLDD
jgi:KRAB domain-containing zinc finger protein